MEEKVISIEEIIDALRKRWIIIVSMTLGLALISGIVSFFFIKPKYEASTKVFIGKESTETTGYNQSEVLMYQQLMKTYSETLKTSNLVKEALETVNTDLTVDQVINGLSVSPIQDTQILTVKFKSIDAIEAKEIVDSVVNEFVEVSKELVPNGTVRVVETVETPENPVSPDKVKNIVIGFLLGLMLSVGLSLLLEFMDNTFKTKDNIEEELELPVLGLIPNFKDK